MKIRSAIFLVLTVVFMTSCSLSNKGAKGLFSKDLTVNLMLPESDGDSDVHYASESIVEKKPAADDALMNTSTDENGETVITDVIAPTTVTAKFVHKPERFGQIEIEFFIKVPKAFFEDEIYQVRLFPELEVMQDTVALDALYLTGSKYREYQNAQYAKFNKYKESIKTDPAAFRRQKLTQKFVERNIPAVSDGKGDIWGVQEQDAVDHYVKRLAKKINDRKIDGLEYKKSKIVRCPIVTENIVLDSITNSKNPEMFYKYQYKMKSRPGLRKLVLTLEGSVYDRDKRIYTIKSPDTLTFYLSSITTLVRENANFDPEYRKGIDYLKNMQYDKAAETLRPFKDFNAALALLTMGYDYAAFRILEELPDAGDVCYLKAIAYLRLRKEDKALESYKKACQLEGKYIHRGNLDPEISAMKKRNGLDDMEL